MLKHRLVTIGLSLALGVVLAVACYIGFLFLVPRDHGQYLQSGTAFLERGLRSLASGDGTAAQERFNEALIESGKVLEAIKTRRESDAERAPEEIEADRRMEGQAFWLRAQALRGAAIAQQMIDKKPLPPIDGAIPEKLDIAKIDQVPMTWIPDETARREAVISLREAALRLPDVEDVQRAAVTLEIQLDPNNWQWQLIPIYAENLLKIDPKDDRARYLLARFEYEQPVPRPGQSRSVPVPTPLARRSKDRMLKALDHVAKLKENEGVKPRWRTLYLEALIHQWLLGYYRSPQNPPSPAQQVQHEVALRTLLFDPATGIRQRAEHDERISKLTRLDIDGMMGLHQMALESTLDEARESSKAQDAAVHARVIEALDATLALSQRLAAAEDTPLNRLAEITDAAVISVARAQPFLATEQSQTWKGYLDAIQSLVQKAMDRKAVTPSSIVALTEMLAREAEIVDKQGQSSRRAVLDKQIADWIDKGLKYGEAQKIPALQLLALHEQAARMKTLGSSRREVIAPHVRVLMESPSVSSRATGLLLEGMLAEREGRLEHARENLEQVVKLERTGVNNSRAHMLLANIYLALGKPDLALQSLAAVKKMYQQFDKLSDEEKAWAKEFVRNENELALMELQAQLQVAQLKYAALTRQAAEAKNSGGRVRPVSTGRPTVTGRPAAQPAEGQAEAVDHAALKKQAILAALKPHEQAAGELIRKFPPNSPMERVARQLEVAYWANTGRLADAQAMLDTLKKDYPESVQVLRQEIQLVGLTQPKDRVAKADAIIQDYLKNFPQEIGGKLLWAEWLINSGRSARAVAYLDDPGNFPNAASDPRVNALKTVAFTRLGESDKALETVQLLPRDASTEALKIRLAGTSADDMQKQVREEMPRYEANGVLACFNANLSYLKGDYVDAAHGYLKALEFTKVKGAARQGVLNALNALARENPEKALELSSSMLQHYPGEPELLMAYAYACLQFDRLGDPAVKSDRPRDMSSALDQMEQAFVLNRQDQIAGPLVKAQFWAWADRPDLARAEIKRALAIDAKNEKALLLGARLAAESADPVDIGIGLEYAKWLKEKDKPPADAFLLEGQLLQRDGKPAEAIKAFELLVDRFPANSQGYMALVSGLEEQKQQDRALQWVQRWRTRLPNDPEAVRAQIRLLASSGQAAEARKIADDFLAAQRKLITEQVEAKKPAQATPAEELAKQRQAVVDARMADIELVLAAGFLEARAWSDAERLIRGVLTRRPESEQALLRLGDLYLARLRAEPKSSERAAWIQQAHRAYQTVYDNHKGHEWAGNNLAWLLAHEENNPEAALRYLQEIRTGRHSNQLRSADRLPAELLDTIGSVYTALNKPEYNTEMRDLFETAKVRYPNDPRMYLYLGNAYAGLRDMAKAKSLYATAISLANQKTRSVLSPEERQAVIDAAKAAQSKLPR